MIALKVCGITRGEDGALALVAGAGALGLIFYEKSPRAVTVEQAAEIVQELREGESPSFVAVGVFVNETRDRIEEAVAVVGLDVVQLSGDEPPAALGGLSVPALKAIRLRSPADVQAASAYTAAHALLVDAAARDAYGGTGRKADWALARALVALDKPVVLAGGLRPENLAEAASAVGPAGLDLCSGVEVSPGRKDPAELRALARAAAPLLYSDRSAALLLAFGCRPS